MEYVYRTKMVCASEIRFDIDNHVVTNIRFSGGCPGNLKALGKILDGWTAEQIEEKLLGNTCGAKPTSCADQLAKAVMQADQAAQKAANSAAT